MDGAKPFATPVATSLFSTSSSGLIDATMYREIIRGLKYLILTLLDVSFVENRFGMTAPNESNLIALDQLANVLNKPLARTHFAVFCSKISVSNGISIL